MGSFVHACEGEMLCESVNPKIPYFNAPIYLENKTAIGKVDEILGPINQVYFTIKPQEGIVATSFKSGDKFYIGGDKLLPLDRQDFYPNRSLRQEQRNLSAPADLREGSQCVEVEEAVEAEELQEAGDSVVTEAAEARAGVEEVDSAPGVVVAVVVMRTSQDRLDFEGEAHRDYVWRCGA
ncbi:MAG: hypothetical protein LQ350_000984 [Teloschistes chrysophthalmus]|nr:MAG: hypothetical protein LQ350_000984 [Niorma chrysophthalma]